MPGHSRLDVQAVGGRRRRQGCMHSPDNTRETLFGKKGRRTAVLLGQPTGKGGKGLRSAAIPLFRKIDQGNLLNKPASLPHGHKRHRGHVCQGQGRQLSLRHSTCHEGKGKHLPNAKRLRGGQDTDDRGSGLHEKKRARPRPRPHLQPSGQVLSADQPARNGHSLLP